MEPRTEDLTAENATCPFAVRRMSEVVDLLRPKPTTENRAELFAALEEDPVNGETQIREFLDGSIFFANGEAHRERRKILNRLFRPAAVDVIREDMVLPAADKLMAERLREPDDDGVYRVELIEFLDRTFLHFTAKLIGLDGVDTTEGLNALAFCVSGLIQGTNSAYLEDRTTANEEGLAAKQCYVEQFYRPSLRRYEELLGKVQAGELDDADVPESVLKLIAARAHPAWEDETKAIVESTLLFSASVATSTQSIIHTIHFLHDWFRAHPEDRERRTEPAFLVRALAETLRLHAPFTPYTTRMAMEARTVPSGEVRAGQELRIEWVAANRDPSVFGDDANEFNPWRPDPSNGLARYGVGFGFGAHLCLGLRVVMGSEGTGGAHVYLLQKLMTAGVRPDPATAPTVIKTQLDKYSTEVIPRYTSYPAIVANWLPRNGGEA